MDSKVLQSINKALDGGELTADELRQLFAVHYLSEESFLIQQASRTLSEATSKGKAEVHAQIGIDTGLCAKNCDFCSFAVKNKLFHEPKVHPTRDIVEKCLQFEADGANAIYLMATAAVKLPEFLKIAREVRAAIKPELPLVANIDDFDEDGARELKAAGFAGIYHCVQVRIIDVRPAERYKQGHIPGAANVWVSDYADANGLVPSAERFAALLTKLGVGNGDTVVLYADGDKHGPAYVAHFWWLLDMFGHTAVRTLDGGLEAWQAAGYPVLAEAPAAKPGDYRASAADKSKLATKEEVLAAVTSRDPAVVILDVRESVEYLGKESLGAPRKGRIPGAVWLYWGEALNADKTVKDAAELRELFAHKGITRDKTVITYCQAGVRAAHTTFVLHELLGYENVKNYAGSWLEWSRNKELPIETGGQ